MRIDVVRLDEVDETMTGLVGGKGAKLGAVARIDGVRVPPGFCVTTDAYRRVVLQDSAVVACLDRLGPVDDGDPDEVAAAAAALRGAMAAVTLPDDLIASIATALGELGLDTPCAVRSSATAEDLPDASFAGQHDSFLDITGAEAVADHMRRCWASLFTDRAVAYRQRQGIDHGDVAMAVVVQRLVAADAAGVLFTADPVTGRRMVASVEAVRGLGDALVAGRAAPDVLTVRDGAVVARTVAGDAPAITDAQALALVELGRRIEAHLGWPQDVEWCIADGQPWIVQSRPITTLFPVPAVDDGHLHVYVSVGHQQMMTDAMKPLGRSLFQLTALPRMYKAGSRLFVDVAPRLADPAARAIVLGMLDTDPLIGGALRTLLERDDVEAALAAPGLVEPAPLGPPANGPVRRPETPELPTDPAIVHELIEANRASVDALRARLAPLRGPAVIDAIRDDLSELKRVLFDPRSHGVYMSAMQASAWLNEHLESWLGERNVADTLTRSVPDNVTSEMGLALLDVADVVRAHPAVVSYFQAVDEGRVEVDEARFLDEVARLDGGPAVSDALGAFLDRYGMRCVGEIDITRPRWAERPTALVPVLLADVAQFEPGEAQRRFAVGERAALAKAEEVLARVGSLPDGDAKAAEVAARIERVRTFMGYREYPKYGFISRYQVYKQALLGEAQRLAAAGVVDVAEDVFFLTFDELAEAARSHVVEPGLIDRRKAAFRRDERRTPPRILTSDGEIVTGRYTQGDAPAGALLGLAVSSGVVEGRARVLHDIEDADLAPGDILVTPYTDPSWSPLFVAAAGLVTEVGGLMTHGAVIAREYGLPAVVGVVEATRRIRDGQRIRVHGTQGYVEVLADVPGDPVAG